MAESKHADGQLLEATGLFPYSKTQNALFPFFLVVVITLGHSMSLETN